MSIGKHNVDGTENDSHRNDCDNQADKSAASTPESHSDKHEKCAEEKKANPHKHWYGHRIYRSIQKVYIRLCIFFRRSDPNKTIAFGTIILGVIGIGSLWLTYQAVMDGRKSFESTQRPLVSLGKKDGTLAEFVVPNDPSLADQNIGVKIYVQNGGQSAALKVGLGLTTPAIVFNGKDAKPSQPPEVPLQTNGYTRMTRDREKNGAWGNGGGGVATIPSQSEYVYFFPDQVSREQYDAMLQGKKAVLLNGICEYCDILGQYTCREFTLFWQGPPFNVFSEVNSVDCAFMYTYRPLSQPGETHLLPCEQPEEREEIENSERKTILERAKDASKQEVSKPK